MRQLNQRGAALMGVLGAAMMFGMAVIVVLSMSMNRGRSTRHGMERQSAMLAAEAGYWWALAHSVDDASFVQPFDGEPDVTVPADLAAGIPQAFLVDVAVTDLGDGKKRVDVDVLYENL